MLTLPGGPALSPFRKDKLLQQLRALGIPVDDVMARHVYFVDTIGTLSETQRDTLRALLPQLAGDVEALAMTGCVVVPRLGYFDQDVGEMGGQTVLEATMAGAGAVSEAAAELKALEQAMASDKQVLLVAQRNASDDSPDVDDLYQVGTVSNILQLLKLPPRPRHCLQAACRLDSCVPCARALV